MNADGLFRGGAGKKKPDISQADLMKVLGHGHCSSHKSENFKTLKHKYITWTP